MPLTIPPGVDANGRRNAIFIPTDTLSAATMNSTGVELICYLSKGTLGMSADTERGTDDRECTTVSAEVLGNTSYSLNDLDYVYEPQDSTRHVGHEQGVQRAHAEHLRVPHPPQRHPRRHRPRRDQTRRPVPDHPRPADPQVA